MNTSNVFVTGSTGFVGNHLVCQLLDSGVAIFASTRQPVAAKSALGKENCKVTYTVIPAGEPSQLIPKKLTDIVSVVHLAGRAHVMQEESPNPELEYLRDNVELTRSVLQQAKASGCQRFIYVSTAKAGSPGVDGKDFYAQSKREAENVVREYCAGNNIDFVILRPPLIYGPGVGANFEKLVKLADNRLPLPFASLANRRSMVSVFNFCSAIQFCLEYPQPIGGTFYVTDEHSYSTTELVAALRAALGKPKNMFSFPPSLLTGFLHLMGKRAIAERLLGSLEFTDDTLTQSLGWQPEFDLPSTLSLMFGGEREGK